MGVDLHKIKVPEDGSTTSGVKGRQHYAISKLGASNFSGQISSPGGDFCFLQTENAKAMDNNNFGNSSSSRGRVQAPNFP